MHRPREALRVPILLHQIRCAGGALHWIGRAASLVFPRRVSRVARRVCVRFARKAVRARGPQEHSGEIKVSHYLAIPKENH
jgi:hypothetical protein